MSDNNISDNTKRDIIKAVESDLATRISDGRLSNDVFKQLNDPDNDYYMDCKPTGHSAEEITAYNVPIDSEYTRDSARIDVYKTLINLSFVLIIMIGVYFTIPLAYKSCVVDVINLNYNTEVDKKDQELNRDPPNVSSNKVRVDRIMAVDKVISLWFLIMWIISVVFAFSSGLIWVYVSVCLALVYIMGVSLVQMNRYDLTYMKTVASNDLKVTTEFDVTDKAEYKWVDQLVNIFKLLAEGIMYMCSVNEFKKVPIGKQFPVVLIAWILMLVVYYLVMMLIYFSSYDKTKWSSLISWEATYFGIVPVFIILPFVIQFCLGFEWGTNYFYYLKSLNKVTPSS